MKIVLANIPWYKNGRWGVRAGSRWPHLKDQKTEGDYLPFPFFLAYSASLLRQEGFNVVLIDALSDKITEEDFIKKIYELNPDLLVAEVSTSSLSNDLDILKKFSEDFKIALCGPETNIKSLDFLYKNDFINFVLYGEYEMTLLELVKTLQINGNFNNVQGLIYKQNKVYHTNLPRKLIKDLDILPWPQRDGLSIYNYIDVPGDIPLPSVQMLASRGCPFKCNFCLWPQIMYAGNIYRFRNHVKVVDEMEYLIDRYGFKSVYFDDDTFNVGKPRMLKIANEIKRRNLSVPWAIMARADLMDEEILETLQSSGLHSVKYGLESSSQEILDKCGKNMDVKKAEFIIRYTKKLGIKIHLTFTFGLPGETEQTIKKSIEKALELDPDSIQFSITTPYPGTKYYKDLKKTGRILTENWEKYDGNYGSVIETEYLTASQLKQAKDQAYREWGIHISRRNKKKQSFKYIFYTIKLYVGKLIRYFKVFGFKYSIIKTVKFLIFLIKFNYFKIKEKLILNNVPVETIDVKREGVYKNYVLRGINESDKAYVGPEIVELDLTNKCNASCLGCWVHSPLIEKNNKKFNSFLSYRKIKKMIKELARLGTKEIQISGSGEPSMHPKLIKIIKYIKKNGIKCRLITNFISADKKFVKKLINSKIDHITISLWAASAKTYCRLHPGTDKKVFYNIKKMVCFLSKLRKGITPEIKIYNVICNFNFNEISQMVDFALNTGADFTEFQVVDIVPGKTEILSLTNKQKQSILKQILELKNKENYFDELVGYKSAFSSKKESLKDELAEFGRFYKPFKKGFYLKDGIKKAVCPEGFESIERIFDEDPVTKKFIKFRFYKEVCDRCKNKKFCYHEDKKFALKVNFLNLLGIGSFVRRLNKDCEGKGNYEKDFINSVPCYVGWKYSRILVDGSVTPCCKADKIKLGNIYKSRFSDIWFSPEYNEFRKNAKIMPKNNPYFDKVNCFKSCDNLGMNLNTHKEVMQG